jgi:hypothetical protein
MVEKKVQSLDEALGKKKAEKPVEVEKPVEEYKDPEGYRDGMRLGAAPWEEKGAERGKDGSVHVWQENPEHAVGNLHPDFEPQAKSPDAVGYKDE